MDNFRGSKAFYKKFQNNIKFSPKQVNSQSQVILAAGDFNRYIELSNHKELIKISEKYGPDNCFCESRQNCSLVNLFFDYDCKDSLITLPDAQKVIDALKAKIQAIFPQLSIKFFVKESVENDNEDLINSMHFICHLSTPDGHNIYFDYSNGCQQLKFFVSKLNLKPPYDHKQAYSGHLLRLLYANKFDKSGKTCNRIFDISSLSDLDDPLKSLSSYCPTDKYMLLSDYLNQNFMIQYVKNQGYAKDYLFEHIKQRENESHLSLTLTEQHTPVCEHRSNNAVCMLYNQTDNPNIIIKCQDEECGKFFQTYYHYDDNRHRCQIFLNGDNSSEKPSSSSTKQSSKRSSRTGSSTSQTRESSNSTPEFQKDKNMIQDISFSLNKVFLDKFGLELDNIQSIDNNYFLAVAKSPSHALSQESRELTGQEKKILFRKTPQGRIETINQPKELQKALSKVQREFNSQQIAQYNVQYNQFDNSIHYHYHAAPAKEEVVYDDAFDEIEFPSELHKDYFISIINDDFQFITELYNLEYPDQFIYVYDDNDKGCAAFFDNFDKKSKATTNGGFWNRKGGIRVAKQRIRDYVVPFFNSIMKQLDNPKDPRRKLVQIKLKSVRNVLKNNIELDQYLYETYFHQDIQFDNIPHFVHFLNGTFDLDQRKFIKTTPDMYNQSQIDYDYNDTVSYDDIFQQFSQIMPKNEFHWFLKQLSNCLNPNKVIEQKQIIILTGKGHNGKTQLLNLATGTFSENTYSYSGCSNMLQSPNVSSSNPTPDIVKLMFKRFCYIPEITKNQPFNQQQVKILTGGEKIQARDLYKSLVTFQPSAGIFISCNQVPNIDATDGGFMNRLKIIDLKIQFVEEPKHQFQKPSNKQLHLLVQTTQWKQGFMNLLIDYYYKSEVKLPKSIQKSIDLRAKIQQNPIYSWAKDNIKYQFDSFVLAEDLRQKYIEDNDNSKITKIAFNRIINEYIQQKPETFFQDVDFKKIDRNDDQGNRVNGQAFTNCCFKHI